MFLRNVSRGTEVSLPFAREYRDPASQTGCRWCSTETASSDGGGRSSSTEQRNDVVKVWGHRIVGWIRPPRSSPTVTPTPPCLLNPVPKCHIHTVFEPLQGWGVPHCPRQPGPRPDHSCRKETSPDLQSKTPLAQPEAIASCPVAGYLGEETNPPHYTLLSGSCRER